MFETILVCSDGSDHAIQAARQAAQIARQFDSCVLLLDVFDTSFLTGALVGAGGFGIDADTIERLMEEQREAVDKRTVPLLDQAGVRHQERHEVGNPVDRIVQTAHFDCANLIVLGSRGMGTCKSLLVGSVSDGVVHRAHCPVLIVRGDASDMAGFRHILLATDGSDEAIAAAKVAAALATKFGAALTMLHVLAFPPHLGLAGIDPGEYAMVAGAQVRRNTEQAFGRKEVAYTFRQETGHPAAEIVRVAAKEDADLIVLGSRGLSGFQALMGSVSERVTHYAHCPVLVVR